MIVLAAAQVLPQSSVGIDSRVAGKASVESSLPGCGAGVSSLTELIASVNNDETFASRLTSTLEIFASRLALTWTGS